MSERYIPENLIRAVAEEEGIRDIDEAHAFVTGRSPVEARLSEEELQKRIQEAKVAIKVDTAKLSPEKKELLPVAVNFARRASISFQDRLNYVMEEYMNGPGVEVFTPEMLAKMRDKKHDLPEFTVMDGESAGRFLKETDLAEWAELNDRNFLMVFNLPKPIARFWYRGGAELWGTGGQEIPEENVEWGRFYREVMPAVWNEVGYEESEGKLDFSRVNGVGEHDPQRYYYIWEVSRYPR